MSKPSRTCGECRWIAEYERSWLHRLLRKPVRHACLARRVELLPWDRVYMSVHPEDRECEEGLFEEGKDDQ